MNILTYAVLMIWASLAVVVLVLALYRRLIARGEDLAMHVAGPDVGLASRQETLAKRLAQIDFWGEVLTIVVVVSGLLLAGFFVYRTWTTTSTTIVTS